MTLYYEQIAQVTVKAKDAKYDVWLFEEFEKGKLWEIEPMCDSFNTYQKPTGKTMVEIMPDAGKNEFDDYKSLRGIMSAELAHQVLVSIIAENKAMWFAKDMVSYAEKYGKLI